MDSKNEKPDNGLSGVYLKSIFIGSLIVNRERKHFVLHKLHDCDYRNCHRKVLKNSSDVIYKDNNNTELFHFSECHTFAYQDFVQCSHNVHS